MCWRSFYVVLPTVLCRGFGRGDRLVGRCLPRLATGLFAGLRQQECQVDSVADAVMTVRLASSQPLLQSLGQLHRVEVCGRRLLLQI